MNGHPEGRSLAGAIWCKYSVKMNFLSHYYFNRYSRDPELVLGCVLPDLLKNADKDIRIRPEAFELSFLNNPRLQSIYKGWQQHMETDRLFHNLPFFYEHTHRLRLALAPLVDETPIRASFLSHIGLELLLDHCLLVDGGVDEEPFYVFLEAADRDTVDRFLRICGLEDTDFFFRFFDAFNRARYIERYKAIEQIMHALLNICRRLWDFQLTTDRKAALIDTLEVYADQLFGEYMQVFEQIDNFS